jgi:hypothetical protein
MVYLIVGFLWVLIGYAGWKVYTRAGFNGYVGLLCMLPVANLVALLYLAYNQWPVLDKN